MIRRVLIYRLGSLGDTVVALPAFNLVARAYPQTERRALTNFPVSAKAPAMAAVLGESGLVHGYFRYPVGTRSPAVVWRLRREIASWAPDLCIYMAAPRGRRAALRDIAFLRLCGVRQVVGAPLTAELQDNARIAPGLWEAEASRLARCLTPIGDARTRQRDSWNLAFSAAERRQAGEHLGVWQGSVPYVVLSIGTKADANDWGDANWRSVLKAIGRPSLGLVLVGAQEEFERSAALGHAWAGPVLNLCGRIAPRISALVMTDADLFLGHDSGPMHLAAAVGVTCVAVFSARNRPGIWFPHGVGHRVFYNKTDCFGCGLTTCTTEKKRCIAAIRPADVAAACVDLLRGNHTDTRSGAAAVSSNPCATMRATQPAPNRHQQHINALR